MALRALATAQRIPCYQVPTTAFTCSNSSHRSSHRVRAVQAGCSAIFSNSGSSCGPTAGSTSAHVMHDWADWETALQQSGTIDSGHHSQRESNGSLTGVTPTPHPAAASTAERDEWEAVLLANERPEDSAKPDDKNQRVYAVIECGSHSTRLLISTGTADVERLTWDTHLGISSTDQGTWQQQQQQQQVHPPHHLPQQQQQQQDPQQGHPQAHHQLASLQPDATAATLDALRHYRSVLHQYNTVAGIAAVATAAVREAAGGEDGAFVAAASSILGCQLQVLSGSDEGRLSFSGSTASLATSGLPCRCLVFDMGGRSTEFAVGIAGELPEAVCSIPLGCLNIQPDNTTQPPPAEVAAAAAEEEGSAAAAAAVGEQQRTQQLDNQQLLDSSQRIISDHADSLQHVQQAYSSLHLQTQPHHLQQQQHSAKEAAQDSCAQSQPHSAAAAAAAERAAGEVVVIGTGGTITTISALLQQLPEYSHEAVHMSTLHQDDIRQLMGQLQQQEYLTRLLRAFPWLTEARASSLLPGCAGILAIMQHLGVQQVLVSDRDLLDGMVQTLLAQEGGCSRFVAEEGAPN